MEATQQNVNDMDEVLKYYSEIAETLGSQFRHLSDSDV